MCIQIQLVITSRITPISSLCPQPWNKSSSVSVLLTTSYKRTMLGNYKKYLSWVIYKQTFTSQQTSGLEKLKIFIQKFYFRTLSQCSMQILSGEKIDCSYINIILRSVLVFRFVEIERYRKMLKYKRFLFIEYVACDQKS